VTRPGLLAALVAIWLMAWGDLSVANVLSGLLVAAALLLLFPVAPVVRSDHTGLAARPVALAQLAGHYVVDLLRSNLLVARDVLDPRRTVRGGFVSCPLRTGSDTVTTVLANLLALSPGTMPVDVTTAPPAVVVHVLQLHDEAEVRARVARLEELVTRAVGSRRALAALDAGGPR
jgi:multicomponent Na+:H+ antiporter subunit E